MEARRALRPPLGFELWAGREENFWDWDFVGGRGGVGEGRRGHFPSPAASLRGHASGAAPAPSPLGRAEGRQRGDPGGGLRAGGGNGAGDGGAGRRARESALALARPRPGGATWPRRRRAPAGRWRAPAAATARAAPGAGRPPGAARPGPARQCAGIERAAPGTGVPLSSRREARLPPAASPEVALRREGAPCRRPRARGSGSPVPRRVSAPLPAHLRGTWCGGRAAKGCVAGLVAATRLGFVCF